MMEQEKYRVKSLKDELDKERHNVKMLEKYFQSDVSGAVRPGSANRSSSRVVNPRALEIDPNSQSQSSIHPSTFTSSFYTELSVEVLFLVLFFRREYFILFVGL